MLYLFIYIEQAFLLAGSIFGLDYYIDKVKTDHERLKIILFFLGRLKCLLYLCGIYLQY
jgi:hypothetical protein